MIVTLSDEKSSFDNDKEEYDRALISCAIKDDQMAIKITCSQKSSCTEDTSGSESVRPSYEDCFF